MSSIPYFSVLFVQLPRDLILPFSQNSKRYKVAKILTEHTGASWGPGDLTDPSQGSTLIFMSIYPCLQFLKQSVLFLSCPCIQDAGPRVALTQGHEFPRTVPFRSYLHLPLTWRWLKTLLEVRTPPLTFGLRESTPGKLPAHDRLYSRTWPFAPNLGPLDHVSSVIISLTLSKAYQLPSYSLYVLH